MKSFADSRRHESVGEFGRVTGRRGSVRAEVASAVAGFSASQSLGAFLSTLGLGDCPSRPERVMVIGGQDRVEKKPLHAFHRQEGCS